MTEKPLNTHLTDAEFTDLLLGSIPPSVTAHLDHCSECSEEARSVSGTILNFERGSRAWAERRAAAQPALVTPNQRGAAWIGLPGFGLAWQAAAVLTLICAGVGVGYQVEHRTEAPSAVASSAHRRAPEVTPATLKADNDLLSAIDGELQAEVTPPASVYGLEVSEHPSHSHRAKRMMN